MQRCYSSPGEFITPDVFSCQNIQGNTSELWHLNAIYTKIIKNKETEMKYQIHLMRQAKSSGERLHARSELRKLQSHCVDLYCYWLKELLDMEIIPNDRCARTLHLMMVGNCHWFLALFGHMKSRAHCSLPEVHFEEAIAAYNRIFDLIENDLPKRNAFYVYLMRRYWQLILDAKNSINQQNGQSQEEDASTLAKSGQTSTADVDTTSVASSPTESPAYGEHASRSAAVAEEAIASRDATNFGKEDEQQDGMLCCPCFLSTRSRQNVLEKENEKLTTYRRASGNLETNCDMSKLKSKHSKSSIRNVFDEICYFVQRICGSNFD